MAIKVGDKIRIEIKKADNSGVESSNQVKLVSIQIKLVSYNDLISTDAIPFITSPIATEEI